MFFKRKQQLERIVPGVERTPDTRTFFIPKIAEIEDKETMKRRFVSPIFGQSVKDDVVVTNDRGNSGDLDRRYDAFVRKSVWTKEEAKKRYGDSYYEFQTINNADKTKLLKGEITPEYLANKKREQREQEAPKVDEQPVEQQVSIDEFFDAVGKHDAIPAEAELPEDFTMEHPRDELGADRFGPIEEEEEDEVLFGTEKPVSEPSASISDLSAGVVTPVFDIEVGQPIPLNQDAEKARANIVTDYDDYRLPPFNLLRKSPPEKEGADVWIAKNIDTINQTLIAFGIGGSVFTHTKGPSVTRYEIALDAGVQTKRITAIADNLQMSLKALSIRIEAPIPGKDTVGIEVPNEVRESVFFGDVVDHPKFIHSTDPLLLAVGLDIDANPVYTSIEGMPHGLVAGSTQSGKSVCIAAIIASIIYRNKPDQVKLLLIDPKKVDLQQFYDLPHLVTPIIDDPKLAVEALKWSVGEMERRYDVLKRFKTVNVKDYYERRANDAQFEKMPRLVIIVEEASDLLISGGPEVEENILKLTQKSRAVGIHLILATQRPSADILKGSIKANIPTRFAFKVPSSVDSMVVLDTTGAEKLLGRGDMLLSENGLIRRLQGAYLSTEEIETITTFIKNQAYPQYLFSHESLVKNGKNTEDAAELDDLFAGVARYVVAEERCSLNKITQEFGVGYNRAVQIVTSLELYGIVSANVGTKPREVLITPEKLEDIFAEIGTAMTTMQDQEEIILTESAAPDPEKLAADAALIRRAQKKIIAFVAATAIVLLIVFFRQGQRLFIFNFTDANLNATTASRFFSYLTYAFLLFTAAYALYFARIVRRRCRLDAKVIETTASSFRRQFDLFDLLGVIPAFLAVVVVLNAFFVSPAIVDGPSMEPTFYENDAVLVYHGPGVEYIAQDIIIIDLVDKLLIKRLIGIPGDHIAVSAAGVFLNGDLIETYVADYHEPLDLDIPEGYCFVLGDNRDQSNDSRAFGLVPLADVLGKVVVKIDLF